MTRNMKASSSLSGKKVQTTPIAVIGIGSVFPNARTTQNYWDNILRKIDCISDVPPSRWKIEDYYDPNPATPDKTYCKRGAFIPDIEFDPMEFGLPPNILEVTDVSQLLSLVVAREALEDAGYGEEKQFDREHTGVVLGVVGMSSKLFTPLMNRLQYPVWEKVLRSSGVSDADTQRIVEKMKLAYVNWEENAFPGAIGNVVAGRICNRFDLGGMNCVVDAACASSLAAIKMAVGELIEGRANMMITGGVDTDNTINTYMCFSKTPAFSKGDRVRTFDAESDGMMVGEGIGMVVLKRLEDAERDGDRVYAVIKAIGTSSDGRFKSIYAPRPAGQAKALRRAYDEAGFGPSTVGLIEAHGTGTMAGDPAEFEGIKEVFGENNPRHQYIALGSVKSQIGHTKAAAGVASLIKTSLALHHKVLPPTLNVTRPNPKFGIESTPFYINTETRPWIRSKSAPPRRAGVSSFGFGGTNYHVVLEEHQAEHQGVYRLNTVAQPILLTAPDSVHLLAACRDALHGLQGDSPSASFAALVKASQEKDAAETLARVGFVAETAEEARQALQICVDTLSEKAQAESWDHPKGIYYRRSGIHQGEKIVALFSGQGSQYLEMGRELAVNFPVVREVYGAMDALFTADGLEPLSSRVYPKPVFDAKEREALSDALTRTEHAQPAIGALSAALYKLLEQAGFKPDFVAGHSFGELTALWAAGVLNDQDYFTLAKARGKAMSPPEDANFDAGTMLAVKGDVEKIQAALNNDPEVTLANWNSNNQVVIAGSKPAMARAQQTLANMGFQTIPLPVSAAFHTPLVGHAQKPFARAIKSAAFRRPQVPVYSNSTGKPHADDPDQIRQLLSEHILNPVLFRDEIENIAAAGGTVFIEFGPKNVLTNLVDNILAGKPHVAVALNANAKKDSDRQLREAVMALRVIGLPLKNFDPYGMEPKAAPVKKKSPVTVMINAGHYVTEKTRSAFENSLNDGFKVSTAVPAVPATQVDTQPAPVEQTAPIREEHEVKQNGKASTPMMTVPSPDYENLLSEFQAHQSETLRLHEQYLRTEEEYARAFAQLTKLQTELVSKGSAAPGELQSVLPLFESLERSMLRFHEHQAETLRVHQRYLETQEQFSQMFMNGVQQPASTTGAVMDAPRAMPAPRPTPVRTETAVPHSTNGNGSKTARVVEKPADVLAATPAPAPAPVEIKPAAAPVLPPSPVPAGLDVETLQAALLQIVSEKTGYPVETLELDMDMEADLGIDSIKRVEILGAMQTQFPELPKVDNTVLAELRTLGQILQQMGSSQPASEVSPMPAPTAVSPTPATTPMPDSGAPAALITGASQGEITSALLQIVSEKTGYPVETLELDMNMEADLGIDSIKRVEILGAMQSQFPDLPKVDNTALAELCTLGQIIEAMGSGLAATAQPEAPAAPEAAAAVPPQIEQVGQVAEAQVAATFNAEALSAALMKIVSEKTGYPVETLELEMDMEADLGIDSIKRVEILGALQEQFPGLPQVDTETLAELRTLGQITLFFSESESKRSEPSTEVADQSPFEEVYDPGIDQGIVIRKILPLPDALDFSLPEGHICLITDDGTDMTNLLALTLLEKNWPVVVLRMPFETVPGRQPLPKQAPVVDLEDMSEASLQSRLSEIASKFGPTAVFVYLDPVGENIVSNDVRFPEVEKSLLKLVFLAAKHLKPALTGAAEKGRAMFMTVTRLDGAFGLGDEGDYTPVSGGLFGLVKTLNLEWEAVFCRALDLSPALDPAQSVSCILAELHDPNRLVTEVGYSQSERSTLIIETVPVTGVKK